jgi:hypothetical protein
MFCGAFGKQPQDRPLEHTAALLDRANKLYKNSPATEEIMPTAKKKTTAKKTTAKKATTTKKTATKKKK